MKRKSFLCLSLSLLTCAHASALTIHNGKIISQKEWSTDNTMGYFYASSSDNLPKKMNPIHLKHSAFPESIDAINRVTPAKGSVGTTVSVRGSHDLDIYNESKQTKQYAYKASLCLVDDNVLKCAYSEQTIELAPGGSFEEGLDSLLKYIPKKAGGNTSYATIQLDSLSGTEPRHLESYTVGDIDIS